MNESMIRDSASSTEALADLGLKAMDLFGRVEKALKEASHEKLPEDLFTFELQRFELWAANMGLFVPGHGSLDYRVREAEKLAQTLRRFMQDLNTSLEDVVEMCSESKQEGASKMDTSSGEESASQAQGDEAMDEDEDEESWDMDLLVDSVRDPINRLFKMSTKIRNPSTRLGSSRAANYRQVDEETGVELLQAMKEFDSDYVKSVFLEFRKTKARRESRVAQPPGGPSEENDDEVWEPIKTVLTQERERENSGAHSYLIDRIVQANFRRRQQFAYWAAHRDKLDKHTKAYQAQKGRLPIAEGQRGGGLGLDLAAGPLPSISSATGLDMARLEISSDTRSNWALSEYAPSTRQAADAPVDFPPAPKVTRKTRTDNFFECPYCFFLCPKDILAEKAWKAHLIHDLRPYICTYENCRSPTQLYDSRRDWVHHENSEHRKIWRCLEHSDKVYESLETYKRHLQEQHAGSITGASHISGSTTKPPHNAGEASLARIIQASESVSFVGKRICPICTVELEAGRSMEGHIALHLERFARFSLPRSVENDDDSSNADSGKANRVDEEGSRDDDFEGAFEIHSHADSSDDQSIRGPTKVGSSVPPVGSGIPGDILKDPPAPEDDDESSSDSDGSDGAAEQPTEDETALDGLEVGEWCTDFEKYEKVERQFWDKLEETERRLGSDHPDTLDCMTSLWDLLRGQRKFKEAEHINWRILELRKKLLGDEHPLTWTSMNEVGFTLFEQGRFVEAEEMHRQVLAKREKELGREHAATLVTLSNLAITLLKLGRLEEAEKLGREAVESRLKVIGPSHPDTLMSMANLALILEDLGQVDEAEKLEREALESRKQILGPSHFETLRSLSNMALRLLDRGRLEEAEELGREAMESRKRVLGPSHADTLASMSHLGDILEQLGQQDEAMGLYTEAAEIQKQVLGPDHPQTLISITGIADVLYKQGRLEESERLFAQVMEVYKQKFGPDHPETLSSIVRMARVLWKQDRLGEAEKLEVGVLEARKEKLGPTHPHTLLIMSNLAHTWHSQGRKAEAINLMEECFQLRRQVLGPEQRDTLETAKKLEEWRAELKQPSS